MRNSFPRFGRTVDLPDSILCCCPFFLQQSSRPALAATTYQHDSADKRTGLACNMEGLPISLCNSPIKDLDGFLEKQLSLL